MYLYTVMPVWRPFIPGTPRFRLVHNKIIGPDDVSNARCHRVIAIHTSRGCWWWWWWWVRWNVFAPPQNMKHTHKTSLMCSGACVPVWVDVFFYITLNLDRVFFGCFCVLRVLVRSQTSHRKSLENTHTLTVMEGCLRVFYYARLWSKFPHWYQSTLNVAFTEFITLLGWNFTYIFLFR